MRKLVILALLTLSSAAIASSPQNALGLGGKILFSVGENTENYDPGYCVSVSYERRFGRFFGLELQPSYSYIYAEIVDNLPFFGAWIDNHMIGAALIPRLYLPVNDRFRLFAGGGLKYAYLKTDVSLYVWYYDGFADRSVEREWSEDGEDHIISYLVTGGAEVSIVSRFGLSFEVQWNPLNVSDASDESFSATEISMDKNSVDDNNVDVNSIGIQLKAKLLF